MLEGRTPADSTTAPFGREAWDRRVREAVRLLETETPPPPTHALGPRVGLTQFHFVRLFTAQVGSSPQVFARDGLMRHVMGRLRYTDDPLTPVAQDFGFARPSAFSRAFRAFAGVSASAWRKAARAEMSMEGSGATPSPVRVETFKPQPLFARRYTGPRIESGAQWADFLGRLPEPLLRAARTGLLYDDPRDTPPEAIRYDCAVVVPADSPLPPELEKQGFERITAPGGEWACADAVGRQAVGPAYGRIVGQWLPTRPDRTLEGDPHLERFLVTPEDLTREPMLTVCLRVRPLSESPRPGLAD